MTQELINTAVQIAVALSIVLLAWLFTLVVQSLRKRPVQSFPRYVGLIAPNARGMAWAFGAAVLFAPLSIGHFLFLRLADHVLHCSRGFLDDALRFELLVARGLANRFLGAAEDHGSRGLSPVGEVPLSSCSMTNGCI